MLCYAVLGWAVLCMLCCAGAVKIDRGKQKGQRVLAWGNHRAGKTGVLGFSFYASQGEYHCRAGAMLCYAMLCWAGLGCACCAVLVLSK